ncbi:MAG: aminotransferase class V-fold PLP-dependent enzyme, partial [Candidatus Acidiferrum sp.]
IVIRQVDIHESDCTLDLEDLRRKINAKTKLVAVGYASNAVGTVNPVAEITKLAHDAGALIFIDAVHYAPHGPIDVRALDCDFLACSPYKFFGPHMGSFYGKREHLLHFRPYKVRPAPDSLPDRWETGTQLHELIAGVGAAIDYLAEVGRRCDPSSTDRRSALLAAYHATRQHEMALFSHLAEGLLAIPGLTFFGISDPNRFHERCSTVSLRLANHTPAKVAAFLGERGIFTWDGNYYALNLTERLGVESTGGLLRIGLVHYNIPEEVDRLLAALREIAAR